MITMIKQKVLNLQEYIDTLWQGITRKYENKNKSKPQELEKRLVTPSNKQKTRRGNGNRISSNRRRTKNNKSNTKQRVCKKK